MKKSTGKPTKAQVERFEALKELGCIACIKTLGIRALHCGPTEIHHLNLGGKAGQKRLGHDFTIPLGPWHHRAVLALGWTSSESARFYGPSLAKQSKAFRERYGSDGELLAEVNKLIGVAV